MIILMNQELKNSTGWGLCPGTANRGYQITDFWLEISKNDNNIIWTSLKNTCFYKVTGVWLKNWAYHTYFKFKIEKDVADLIFEPHPPNFQNQENF